MPVAERSCPACSSPLPAEAQFCMHCGKATPTEPGVPPRTMPTGAVELAKVRRVLADRYQIDRVIGEGGMATVYLAEDLKHKRHVAIKVMRPELAATLGTDRFLREVEIAAQLSHPHILPMYDSGDADGVLYYVMPYVEGESLAARIAREGELPVGDALRLAREIAEALGYAHRRGFVHRDIKPANILLNEGHAMVADFGIARALSAQENAITATGLAVGTPQYMSPEQATGERDVNARADVYALGAVLYEMLTGEPPFTGRTAQAVVSRILTERPRPLGATREGLPASVQTVVSQALARSPADRYASGSDFAAALDRMSIEREPTAEHAVPGSAGAAGAGRSWLTAGALAIVALTVVAFMAGRWGLPTWMLGAAVVLLAGGAVMLGLTAREEQRRSAGRASTGLARQFTWRNAGLGGFAAVLFWSMLAVFVSSNRARTSGDIAAVSGTHVAVLPFQNQGDSADNYIVDGIADEIRGKLARINGLTVIASNSSAQYRNSTLPPASVASQLGANYLLQGRVRWAGGDQNRRVQVVAELVDGRSGATTWQQTFEAPLTDVFEVQSQIASRVAGALGTQLGTRDARELARRPTVSPAAWDAYLKGKAITAVDPTSMRVAAGFFEQAVALDSSFVEAWAGLSFSMARVFYNGGRELRAAVRSREAMERAIAADPNAAQGYAAQALYYTNVDPNPSRSSEALATALRLAPNDPEVLASAGRADVNTGRLDAGVERLQRARELDPRSIAVLSDLLRALVSAGLFREAIEVGDAAVALSPSDPGVYEFIVMAQIALGDFDAARAVTRRAINNGVSPPTLAAYFSGFFEMSWVLEDEVRAVIPRLTPAAFDGDRAWWGQALSTHHWLQGNRAAARAYADSALAPSLAQITGSPDNPSVQVLYALMLAYTGAKDSAVALGRRAIQQYQGTQTRSFASAYDRLQLIRTYLAVGEFDAAIDELQIRLQQGGPITREWLRLDPTFAPLRGNPRFERLVSGG